MTDGYVQQAFYTSFFFVKPELPERVIRPRYRLCKTATVLLKSAAAT